MDKQSNSTAVPESIGELSANIVAAVAANRDRDVAVAAAMRDLETQVYDLANMTSIMADLYFSDSKEMGDETAFSVNEVHRRVDAFKTAYLAAWEAGQEA